MPYAFHMLCATRSCMVMNLFKKTDALLAQNKWDNAQKTP